MIFKKTYTTEEIIQGCVDNQRRFQEILYRTYFDKMYNMCSRYTNDEEETLSILNNGFLKVFQKVHTFEFKGSFEGWIRRIVYHSMVEFMRKRSRYLQFIVLDAPAQNNGQAPDILPSLYMDDLLSLMVHVPKASAKVFEMYAIEGYNHREIGEILGMSENTSKWHLANARNFLKKQLEKNLSEKNKVNLG